MRRSRGWTGGLAAIGIVLVGVLVCPPVDAGKPADPAPTLLERVDREMTRLRVQIKNGRVRYENGILGVDTEGLDPNQPPTPFTDCCTANLKKIKAAVSELAVVLGELGRCYEEAENLTGAASVPLLADTLGQFDKEVDALAGAPIPRAVERSLADLTRAYLQMRDQVDQLDDCAAAGAKGKKKKKKAKSQTES